MSEQQWKLVPVPATEEMVRAALSRDGAECDPRAIVAADYLTMIEVAPQPPALAGEPEVMAFLHSSDGYMNERWVDLRRDNACNPRALVLKDHHRAHVARLQAEVEVSQFRAQLLLDQRNANDDKVGKLQARTAELEGLLRDLRARGDMPRVYLNWIDKALAEGAKS